MVQHVLTIAGAVAQTTDQLHQLRMDAVDANLDQCTFALLLNGGFYLTASLFNHFLNACGMDSSVSHQFFQCHTGNFPANRFKAGNSDGFRRIIDDQINAGERFNRADISTFSADDPTLHFIIWQLHHRNRCFRSVIRSAALNCLHNNFSCGIVGFVLHLLLKLHNFSSFLVDQLVL